MRRDVEGDRLFWNIVVFCEYIAFVTVAFFFVKWKQYSVTID